MKRIALALAFALPVLMQSCMLFPATLNNPGPDPVVVTSDPPGADVYIGGSMGRVGKTPIQFMHPRRSLPFRITVMKEGYKTKMVPLEWEWNGMPLQPFFWLWSIVDAPAGNLMKLSRGPHHVKLEPIEPSAASEAR